ncbi:hypothetical protein DC347_15565 [Pseudarthrobacter sp. AG30]|uniref:hypothetical protein n=1 Tax=Pseudarthrobacter sp. AG30 TaxID=2249742 RepID=UPI000D6DCEDE|nr:hypothetical protein [Pseudarthrobacter sp. AG30]RAX15984.1 hypothetical protein DC347_15565 [Pseudarthrobacter sp. AG30]
MAISNTEIAKARTLLDQIVAKLIDVSTGGQDLKKADPQYKELLSSLNSVLGHLGLQQPIPWESLSDWRGHWRANFETYKERRDYINELASLLRLDLDRLDSGQNVSDPGSPDLPTWPKIDARIEELAAELRQATTLDGWQDCGRRSREILVDMSKVMSTMPLILDSLELPQAANGKAWYDAFLEKYAEGASRSDFRKFYRAAWDLSQKTTHGSVDGVEAFASAQAVILIVRLTERMLAVGPRTEA